MAHLVVCVVDKPDQCTDLLAAWTRAGAPGATILESSGMGRHRAAAADDLPLFPSLRDLELGQELHHRTLFSVVPDEAVATRLVEATHETLGDLNRHHTGILFVVPVTQVVGLRKDGGAGTAGA